ncbi:MAG: hypothetical protein JW993_07980 [Sedimentisphaerales bacterium]|nr:hypothetical protein [Sedimentisphaerales bacterium]
MQPADDVKQLFEDAQLGIRPEPDERVFQDMLQAQENTDKDPTVSLERWRIVMKSPLSKLAIAAAVVVAGIAGLFLWTGTQPSVALADVLTRMQDVRAYVFRSTSTITGLRAGDTTIDTESRSTVTTSEDYGMKMVMETVDPNGSGTITQEMYMSPQNGTALTIMRQQKKYMRMEYDESMAERMRGQNSNPSAIVQLALGQGYESLGRETLDGVEVEKFRSTGSNFLSSVMDGPQLLIYVDVETQLPVRMEMDAQMAEGTRVHTAMYDFQWDVVVDAAEFNPVIPDDYTPIAGGTLKMPAMNEETAIRGLGLCVELTGRYPEKLDMMSLMSQMRGTENGENPLLKQLQEENKDLTQDERVRKLVDMMMPIQAIGTFHAMLVAEKKDPAYYGEFVTPEDADQVLMRWKVSDSEYRVIFGNLHVETVDAATLAELEKTIPK